jgi:predicted TIM-barrel fold metal-dependent hydrolase
LGNAHGQYLGDPSLDPLMEELNARVAVVFLHPTALPGPIVPELPAFITDFPIDTTRAVANLVRHHVPRRFPQIKWILAHAGGAVPYLSHRLSQLTLPPTGYEKVGHEDFLSYLRGFYYDTALSASPASFPSLLKIADPERIFYGSDWPWVPESATDYFTDQLDTTDQLDDDQKYAVNRGNALKVFKRFND